MTARSHEVIRPVAVDRSHESKARGKPHGQNSAAINRGTAWQSDKTIASILESGLVSPPRHLPKSRLPPEVFLG